MSLRERFLTPEVLTFLSVGGVGYVVDVVSFNEFRSMPVLAVDSQPQPQDVGTHALGKKVGEWKIFNPDGSLKKTQSFKG